MEGKKSRINNNTDLVVDRISDLPDSLLGHILSFLTNTDEAVMTSVLSKRWKFAWVNVHNLDFYNCMKEKEKEEEKEEEIMEFVRFVNRALLLNGAGSLNKFSLTCRPRLNSPFSTQIISWINTAITRNVHELYLSIGDIDMPANLFSCNSLRSLDLYGYISIDDSDTTAVCLPRLESLKIEHVSFESEEACENLISRCPILHFLDLNINDYGSEADDSFTCIISSTSLRRLEIYFEDRNKLKLKTSSLEYLRLGGHISEIFVEKKLTSLVEAYFNIDLGEDDFLNNSIVEAVRAFHCAKFLTLSADVMRALSCATIGLLTKFPKLVKLEAGTFCSSLQDFIQSSCNLEALGISQDSWLVTSDPRDLSNWNALVEVPRCLSNSLKRVYFGGYNGLEDEREMIRYMLAHGSALEVMEIYCNSNGDGEKLELLQEVCEFPRKSPACKVQFCVWPTESEFKPLL